MKYKVIDIIERVERGIIYCMMHIEVDTNEIKSTGLQIAFEMKDGESVTKDFIERKIKEKIIQIQMVEQKRKEKKKEVELLKQQFLNFEGEM